jgi:rod shape-determining protein MreC
MLLPKKYRIGLSISIIVIAALLTLFYNVRHTSPGIWRKTSLEIVSTLETFITLPLKGLRDVWIRYIFLVGLEEKNRQLERKNARLTEELINYREGYLEAIRLQKILGLQKGAPYPMLAARVTGRSPSAIFKMIMINRGETDGVHAGLPVVSINGVVGRILETSWNVSRVLLIIDENSNLDALIQGSRAQGILQGAATAGCTLKYVNKTAEIKAGDIVITSGLGGVFPKGLPLGIVKSASKKEADMFQKISVAPFADLALIEEVLVIMPEGRIK